MAIEFLLCTVPPDHLRYLRTHQGSIDDYLAGTTGSGEEGGRRPAWWPRVAPEIHDCWGANHRNVDLYHWILNGGPQRVAGPGALFQAWFDPDHPAGLIKLDAYNRRFALEPGQLTALRALAAGVDLDRVLAAFTEWCKDRGEPWEDLDQYACQPFVDEFQRLTRILDDAIARGDALVW